MIFRPLSVIISGVARIRNPPVAHAPIGFDFTNSVTSMECRFPAMLVLWLGREFYRGMYGNARRMQPSSSDLGDKMQDLKNSRIFLISLLRAEIRTSPGDASM
ncbi:hypothetical protein AVEN_22319-1 [Araneus ventricosus]|uniref:Uncharacterized protein n=1 Tax=Araneus ventricosus TaxID=182803 RepID=A0A4Y2VF70_ARAVE|nr:hypothetical protein AVEN_22319-1 [Araneus ventricosus]